MAATKIIHSISIKRTLFHFFIMATLMVTTSHHKLMIAVLALLSIFPPLATDMYLPALGAVASDLQASASATELSISMFFLGLGVGQVIFGPMIDAYGRKLPLLLAATLFIISSILILFVNDIVLFNLLRLIQAVGACAGMVISRAIVSDLYQGHEAAKVMTILVMLMTIGPIVSPTLGSILFTTLGWHSIFVLLVLIGITALILAKLFIPETLPPERRVQRPFRDALANAKILIRQRNFILPVVVAAFAQSGMFAFITASSNVFQHVFQLSALQYGVAFAVIAMALLTCGQVNKVLLNHFSPTQILSVALPVYASMALMTTVMSSTSTLWMFALPLWFSIGFVSLISSNGMALAMGAARERAGTGSALLGLCQFSLAFLVSSCVAFGSGSDTALPMSLGILLPSTIATIIWWVNKKSLSYA